MPRTHPSRTVLIAVFALLGCLLLGSFPTLTLPRVAAKHRGGKRKSAALLPIKSPTMQGADETTRQRVLEAYGKLPLSFEVNRGQFDNAARYVSRGNGFDFQLYANEAVFIPQQRPTTPQPVDLSRVEPEVHAPAALIGRDEVHMKLKGARRSPRIEEVEQLPGKSNYYSGNEPSKRHVNVPSYARVIYRGVYPGVDMVYYGKQSQLEYDFVLRAGVDPKVIRLVFTGMQKIRINEGGELVLETSGGELRQHKPIIYQEKGGRRTEIAGGYTINEQQEVGFEVLNYDARLPLIIDPVLSFYYSTYLGNSGPDFGYAVAVDATGNAYLTGQVQAADPDNLDDAFVKKLNASGSALLYTTYLGGSNTDIGLGIATGSAGTVFLTGRTDSQNFPISSARFPYGGSGDAFVAKLDADGGVPYATFLGGNASDQGNAIAVDSADNFYVTGVTSSPDFPTTIGAAQTALGGFSSDAFVTKFNAAGRIVLYSTFLGGNQIDSGNGIAVNSVGNAFITGRTASSNFPVMNASQPNSGGGSGDAFVTKLQAADGALSYSTYLGGFDDDGGRGIAVDSAGHAFVTGYTRSINFPVGGAVQQTLGGGEDAFVTKLAPASNALIYSTFLGGSGNDQGWGIAADSGGAVYVTGYTESGNFPREIPLQETYGTNRDAFVTKLNATGSAKVYSTYLGGSGLDRGRGIAVDSLGRAYVIGHTSSPNFPIFPPGNALQSTLRDGFTDPFITKFIGSGEVPDTVAAYAPYVRLHSEEDFLPADATNFIAHSSLRWSHGGGCDDHEEAARHEVDTSRLGTGAGASSPPYTHKRNSLISSFPIIVPNIKIPGSLNCFHSNETYSTRDHTRPHDKNREVEDGIPILAHLAFAKEGFFLDPANDLILRAGFQGLSADASTYSGAPVYFDYEPGKHIVYWFFYAYDDYKVGAPPPSDARVSVQSHEGDWERISIKLDANDVPIRITYFYHDEKDPKDFNDPAVMKLVNTQHPIVYSAIGSHASYLSADKFPVEVGDDYTDNGPAWSTWKYLVDVKTQPWYGFGGAWGEVGDGLAGSGAEAGSYTGPLGPSKYKAPKLSDWVTQAASPQLPTQGIKGNGQDYVGQRGTRLSESQTADPVETRAIGLRGNPGDLLISEFRLAGSGGARDEFIELYNNSENPIDLDGFMLSANDPSIGNFQIVFPATIVPPKGHVLVVDNGGYNLGSSVSGDFDLAGCQCDYFIDGQGIELLNPEGVRVDAVGFAGNDVRYREGLGLPVIVADPTSQLSFVRKLTNGLPQDTDDNVEDFALVATNGGSYGGVQSQLGAPGPENLNSPIQRNASIKARLIEPNEASSDAPNRVRDATPNGCGGPNCAAGTLDIRRRFVNTTQQTVTALRFRVVNITTLGTPNEAGGAQADVRLLDSTVQQVETSLGSLLVQGTVVTQSPNQPLGGGLNSGITLALPQGGLAPGGTIDVRFVLGVVSNGRFSFFVNVEANLTNAVAGSKRSPGTSKKSLPQDQ